MLSAEFPFFIESAMERYSLPLLSPRLEIACRVKMFVQREFFPYWVFYASQPQLG